MFKLAKKFYGPFIFANNSFSKIRSINSDRDDFMGRSWAKMSKFIPLSNRLQVITVSGECTHGYYF
jgi:hypothetical protein